MITFLILDRRYTAETLGYLPGMLSPNDPRPAREQFDANYMHGGWHPFKGITLNRDKSISYPGDPDLKPWAIGKLREETILVYPADWVLILQPDGSYEISRMD